ncbi:MAG: cell division protein FtsX [Acidimicrobiales bacterium]
MLHKIRYVLAESFGGMLRNPTLSIASIVVIMFGVSTLGSALLVQKAAENGEGQFRDGVEFVIYLDPGIPGEELDALRSQLDTHPQVKSYEYLDEDAAYADFVEIMENRPELVDALTPQTVPTSFRVKPTEGDQNLVEQLVSEFADEPGVFRVVDAGDETRAILAFADFLGQISLVFALFSVVSGIFLIYNTVRVSMFARRREIEVMKLVGATNMFIRIPYIVEGLVQSLLGGVMGVAFVRFMQSYFRQQIIEGQDLTQMQRYLVTDAQLFTISWTVLLGGAAIGMACSAFAVGRFLDV